MPLAAVNEARDLFIEEDPHDLARSAEEPELAFRHLRGVIVGGIVEVVALEPFHGAESIKCERSELAALGGFADEIQALLVDENRIGLDDEFLVRAADA